MREVIMPVVDSIEDSQVLGDVEMEPVIRRECPGAEIKAVGEEG